jgi:4-oxalocrotonate tautomerase
MEGPKLNKDQKAELVKSFSETASKVTEIPVSAMVVIIRELEGENAGVGGCLLCDMKK